jgi:hypothetical protein
MALVAALGVMMVLILARPTPIVMVLPLVLIVVVAMHEPIGFAAGKQHDSRQGSEQGRQFMNVHEWSPFFVAE